MNDMRPELPPEIAQTLVTPAAYADGRIFEAYRWMRANQPLALACPPGFDPFWAVTRFADVEYVSRNNALFSNGDRSPTIVDQASDALIRSVTGGSPHLMRTLIHIDAPDHSKLRALTQLWFMPANLRNMEARIRTLAKATVERMLAGSRHCDFVNDVALHYPLRVVMQILGVPPEDEPLMLKLTQEIFAPLDPDLAPRLGHDQAATALGIAMQESVKMFGAYFGPKSAERRRQPRDDLMSVIANATLDGKPLPPEVELGYYTIVAAAGHDTTSSSTAGAVWALCDHPDIFDAVRADPSRIPALVDEAIRWTTPVKTFMRTATQDTELAGHKIAKDEWLMLCYASANRDEAQFEEPDRFRIDRKATRHLAFGYGAHVCLGQHLAKMEIRILLEELLPRLRSIRLDGTPSMVQAMFVNGPKTLPIHFEPA